LNKDLYNKNIYLPKELTEYLGTCFNYVTNANANTEGFNRNQELRDSGYVTYQQLGRIKNWFDGYNGDGKDAPYILNGGDYMKSWVDRTLDHMRRDDSMNKEIRQEFQPEMPDKKLMDDMGWLADMNRPSKEHSNFVDDVKITENLKRINEIMKKLL
jgi:hypothetical protein